MIHVFVGTKAQFIKMAPIMQELDGRGIDFNFIDAGQHGGLTGDLLQEFNLREPDTRLRQENTNINTIRQAVGWTLQNVLRALFQVRRARTEIFQSADGICLIHGDTLTTLLSLIYSKRCGLKVAHVEAGLRSFDILNPFPEELIRLIAMRYSDILFAPSDWAAANLQEMGYGDKTICTEGNTIIDTIRYALINRENRQPPDEGYALVTTHRVETIFSRARLNFVVNLIEHISTKRKTLFVLHDPTRKQLERFGFMSRLHNRPSIEIRSLQPYLSFINLVAHADFVISDGGSIQEECHVLGIPCLILRTHTERMDGLGQTAFLAHFSKSEVQKFFKDLTKLQRNQNPMRSKRPSRTIVESLLTWA